MRLSYGAWGETIDEMVDASRAAEKAGFSTIWSAEFHRSAFVPLAAVAGATSSVGVGTAIALAFVRSPFVTALEALDLDELSGGRFTLGLGTGVRRLNEDWHNTEFGRPVTHLRETVAAIRQIIATSHTGAPMDLDGTHERLRVRGYQRPFPPVRRTIPIYLAAVGEHLTRLAGEIGDGWIAHELGSPGYLRERILPNLADGLERSGRHRGQFQIVASACCVPHRDGRQARRWAAGLVAFYATVRTYDPFFAFHGYEDVARRVQQLFREGDLAGAAKACPDELVDALTLAGTPDEVRERLRAYEGLVDEVKLSPPTHFVDAEVTRLAQRAIVEVLAP